MHVIYYSQAYYYGGHADKLNQIKKQVDPSKLFSTRYVWLSSFDKASLRPVQTGSLPILKRSADSDHSGSDLVYQLCWAYMT